jgi:hypothetical protein
MPSTNLVNSTLNPAIISIVSHSYNTIGSNYNSSGSGASSSALVQPGPSRFILIGSPSSLMGTQHIGSLTDTQNYGVKGMRM